MSAAQTGGIGHTLGGGQQVQETQPKQSIIPARKTVLAYYIPPHK
jgi:hypothetical protein